MTRFQLPNGLTICATNRREVAFLYDEIIGQNAYLRHGLSIAPGDCVFDVGANIGLFTLAITRAEPTLDVHAIEPIPATYALLVQNGKQHFPRAVLHNIGLGAAPGIAAFSHYPRCSGWSTRYPDPRGTRRDVAAYVERRDGAPAHRIGSALRRLAAKGVAEYLLRAESVSCRILPLSMLLADHGVTKIDLLKVDVERAELDVLEGIWAPDWPRIRQLVVEVHAIEDRVRRVVELLRARGFAAAVEQLSALEGTRLHMVYARRPADP